MQITGGRPATRRITPGTAVLIVTLLLGACRGGETASGASEGPRATPAPGWALESVPRDSLLAYGGRLAFDTSHGASDGQSLIIPASGHGRPSIGPYASIQPEIGTASLTRSQLGSGRIIAQIDSRASYAPLGLDSGRTYLWVDSMGSMTAWRMVLIASRASTPLRWTAMAHHSGTAPRRSSVAFATTAAYAFSVCRWTEGTDLSVQPCCYCEEWGWCTGGASAAWMALAMN